MIILDTIQIGAGTIQMRKTTSQNMQEVPNCLKLISLQLGFIQHKACHISRIESSSTSASIPRVCPTPSLHPYQSGETLWSHIFYHSQSSLAPQSVNGMQLQPPLPVVGRQSYAFVNTKPTVAAFRRKVVAIISMRKAPEWSIGREIFRKFIFVFASVLIYSSSSCLKGGGLWQNDGLRVTTSGNGSQVDIYFLSHVNDVMNRNRF